MFERVRGRNKGKRGCFGCVMGNGLAQGWGVEREGGVYEGGGVEAKAKKKGQ